MKIAWAGQTFEMLPDKALWWVERQTLIFSDVHLGKAHDFQAAGIPIPSSIHNEDLERMDAAVARLNPERVFVLGDFVHSHKTNLDDLIAGFQIMKGPHKAKWTLALGNHDMRAKEKLEAWDFDEIVSDIEEEGILFAHDRKPSAEFTIMGHVHPVIRVGSGRDRMRLPCFVVSRKVLTLPSFGSFTGGFEVQPSPTDKVFAVAEGQVVDL